LNLDKDGHFLRFNVGQEYCIQLMKYKVLIVCDRTTVKPIIEKEKIPILVFWGKHEKEFTDIDKTSDCLVKVKNSIGCVISIENISEYIDFFTQSNQDFIRAAMNTSLRLNMRQAHSIGAVDYILTAFDRENEVGLLNFAEYLQIEKDELNKAKILSRKERLEILDKSNKEPAQTIIKQKVFLRNQYVIAEVLFRANGLCERCKNSAPFLKNDGTPFLEVHHKIPLSEGGYDTVENAIALCPNCHRHAHYGKNTY
jgi:RNA polymerase-interacting CarD/CdnL/TRCF family regulator